jgi:hypothetical protein
MPEGEAIGEELIEYTNLEDVEDWMKEKIQARKEAETRKEVETRKRGEGREGEEEAVPEEDRSYLDYFYRSLDEQAEFYYLYEQGVGWKCGCTTRDVSIRGRLVPLYDWLHWRAIEV